MRREDPRARMIEDGRLDPARQQRLGVPCEELVERVVAAHDDAEPVTGRGRPCPTAAGATRPFPESRPRSRSRAGRCRSRARARPWPKRRAGRRRQAAARSRVAVQVCSPPGTERGAAPWRASTRSTVKRCTSSAAFRLFVKQIVRNPRETRPAISRDASPRALARWPSSASSSGGFQIATRVLRAAPRHARSPSRGAR